MKSRKDCIQAPFLALSVLFDSMHARTLRAYFFAYSLCAD